MTRDDVTVSENEWETRYSDGKDFQKDYYYLTSDGEFDYYASTVSQCPVEADGEWSYSALSIEKYKGKELVCKKELSDLDMGSESYCRPIRAVVKDGYLYFILCRHDGGDKHSVYRIDTELKKTEVYLEKSSFGLIGYTTLLADGDSLVYITEDGDIVRYDGKEEKIIAHAKEPYMANGEYKAEFIDLLYNSNWIEQPNYTVCVRGDKIFLAYMDKLYEYKNGKVKNKPLPLPVFNGWVLSYCITRIEFCEENPDYLLLYVKTAKVSGEPDTYENAIFIYNIKTGRKSYFARPVENEFLFSSYAE